MFSTRVILQSLPSLLGEAMSEAKLAEALGYPAKPLIRRLEGLLKGRDSEMEL